jgi:hypothetical protein
MDLMGKTMKINEVKTGTRAVLFYIENESKDALINEINAFLDSYEMISVDMEKYQSDKNFAHDKLHNTYYVSQSHHAWTYKNVWVVLFDDYFVVTATHPTSEYKMTSVEYIEWQNSLNLRNEIIEFFWNMFEKWG